MFLSLIACEDDQAAAAYRAGHAILACPIWHSARRYYVNEWELAIATDTCNGDWHAGFNDDNSYLAVPDFSRRAVHCILNNLRI
jgi:hypothetical protein